MRLEKHAGLILYSFALGEADQIITCLTSVGNVVKFVAKGSRKVKSKSSAAVQLFNLGEYVIYKGQGLPYLRQADIINSFSAIRKDWTKIGAALAVLELCRLLIAEEAGEISSYDRSVDYLLHINKNPYSSLCFDGFRMQFVASLGYGMDFCHCTACGQAVDKARLSWPEGGAICCTCNPNPDGSAGAGLLRLLDHLQNSSFAELDKIDLEPKHKQQCAKVVDSLIFWLTEGKTKAQAFRKMFEDGQ
jgi:DNA repair protein RecO (recombination protein O)